MPVAEPCIQDITGQGKPYRCAAVMHARTDQAMSIASRRAAWLQVSGDDDMKNAEAPFLCKRKGRACCPSLLMPTDCSWNQRHDR